MNAVEFTTELSANPVLPVPKEAAAQLPKSGKARVIVLTGEEDTPEDEVLTSPERRAKLCDEFLKPVPQPGEVWFVDFGYDQKPRYAYVVATSTNARLALASVVTITTQFGGTPIEVTLPRVPWLSFSLT